MPIDIVLPTSNVIGPGINVTLQSSFIGPLPVGATWAVTLFKTGENELYGMSWRDQNNPSTIQWLDLEDPRIVSRPTSTTIGITPADTVRLSLLLTTSTGSVIDSGGEDNWKYDPTTGLPFQIEQTIQGQSQGLTEEQAEQLEGTAETSAVALLTDALTLTEATSGPSPGPLVIPLGVATFGVIVRLATIPNELEPQTPDHQYWVRSLATVRVFRGNDLWFRVPIHTPTKIVPFAHEGLQVWVSSAELNRWILNIRVLVDFLPGVTGQVFLMHTP